MKRNKDVSRILSAPLRNHSGATLIVVFLILLLLSLIAIAGMSVSTTEIRIAGNQYRGTQALLVADGGGEMVRSLLGNVTAEALIYAANWSVDWTNVPGTDPPMRFRVANSTGTVKNPAIGFLDFAGVRVASLPQEMTDPSAGGMRARFTVGIVEGDIPSLNITRRVEMEISVPASPEYGGQ